MLALLCARVNRVQLRRRIDFSPRVDGRRRQHRQSPNRRRCRCRRRRRRGGGVLETEYKKKIKKKNVPKIVFHKRRSKGAAGRVVYNIYIYIISTTAADIGVSKNCSLIRPREISWEPLDKIGTRRETISWICL